MECSDQRLRAHKKINVLEENTTLLLPNIPMIALLRAHDIFNEAITIPMRLLTTNSYTLADHDLSVRSMCETVDRIYEQALALKENHVLIVNEEFVMGVMKLFKDELPPFADSHEHRHGKKT